MVYYNWRYYNTRDGRWLRRDRIHEFDGFNLYSYLKNHVHRCDYLGEFLLTSIVAGALVGAAVGFISRVVGDIIKGKRSSAKKYASAIIGGAVGGAIKSKFVGALASSVTETFVDYILGEEEVNPCKFLVGVTVGTVLSWRGSYVKMPHLEQPIKNWIKKEMTKESGWVFTNLKKEIEKGIKDGIRVDKLYSFSKEVYRKLPAGLVSTSIPSTISRISSIMSNDDEPKEIPQLNNHRQPESLDYYSEIYFRGNIYFEVNDEIYSNQFEIRYIRIVPDIDENLSYPQEYDMRSNYLN